MHLDYIFQWLCYHHQLTQLDNTCSLTSQFCIPVYQARTAAKCFSSPDGDHLTLVNVYRAVDGLLEKRKMEFGNEKSLKGKNEKFLRKWCRENFINGRSLRHARDIHRSAIYSISSLSFPRRLYFFTW